MTEDKRKTNVLKENFIVCTTLMQQFAQLYCSFNIILSTILMVVSSTKLCVNYYS